MADEIKKGLEGVVMAETELSYVDGERGKLIYRGYDIEDLALNADFEEVLFLLWRGRLPNGSELNDFSGEIAANAPIDDGIFSTLESLASADEHPMAALRTAVSMLSAYDPDRDAEPGDLEAMMQRGKRITSQIPTLLSAYDRIRNDQRPIDPDPDRRMAENFLYMLTGDEPTDLAVETFEISLILHADHGMNASTFTSLVVSSTLADLYCGVTGGISALSGSLHGGANQAVMNMLREVDESSLDAERWIKQAYEEGRRIPGYGHRVYEVKDPRAHILGAKAKELVEKTDDTKWYNYASTIEAFLAEKGLPDKGIAPNVDFYSGTVYDQLGIPLDMFTPIFAMSRAGGWIAHIIEYRKDNRLIRPRARYIGPKNREFVPISER